MGLFLVFLFIAIAYASWQAGSHLAYIMASFIGAGNVAYMIGNGLEKEVWYVWVFVGGLLIVGYLREQHEKPK
jgi:hypothetical protein